MVTMSPEVKIGLFPWFEPPDAFGTFGNKST